MSVLSKSSKAQYRPRDLSDTAPERRRFATPLPMQYLGAKTRISDWIIENIGREIDGVSKLFDLMAGTGSVAYKALELGYSIGANDLQPGTELVNGTQLEAMIAAHLPGIFSA